MYQTKFLSEQTATFFNSMPTMGIWSGWMEGMKCERFATIAYYNLNISELCLSLLLTIMHNSLFCIYGR